MGDIDSNSSLASNASTNGSNLAATGIIVATKEGILVAYGSLIFMALVPIVIGSFRSIVHHRKDKESDTDVDVMSAKDAAMFPLVASCALFGLYVVFKLIGKEYVNLLLNCYIFLLSSFSFSRVLGVFIKPYLPSSIPRKSYYFVALLMNGNKKKAFLRTLHEICGAEQKSSQDGATSESDRDEPAEASEDTLRAGGDKKKVTADPMDNVLADAAVDTVDIACLVVAVAFGGWYLMQKHWFANNVLALSFAVNGIEMISLDRVLNGIILLGGLFLYDIFWVFGTDVMVTVAKLFDAPIKLVFPMDILEHGWFAKNFALLGLGDIVIPGIFVALMLRFDNRRTQGGRLYFLVTFVAYFIGLLTTVLVMHRFKHAQPALLYLVPACLGTPLFTALVRGDLSAMFSYSDHPDQGSKKND